MMLTLTPLEPRDALSGTVTDYPRETFLAASGRYAAFDLPDARDDVIVIPPWPARVEIPVSADPATPGADISQALLGVAEIPRSERIWLAGRGVSVRVSEGAPSSLPQLSYLSGPIGQVGGQGASYGDEIGLADFPTLTAYVRSNANSHFTLHEVAHLLEPLLTPAQAAGFRARAYPELRDYFGDDTRFGADPSEALAEGLARRWDGWWVPQVALDFYAAAFAG